MKKIQSRLYKIEEGNNTYYIEELDIHNLRVYKNLGTRQYINLGIVNTYKEAFNLIKLDK